MSSNDMSVSANAGAQLMDAKAASASAAKIAPQGQRANAPEAPVKAQLTVDPDAKRRALQEAVAEMNRQMESQSRNLAFQIDDVANRTVIKVRHKETGEVVRQIPDETVLRVAHNIEAMKGLMHDKQV